MPFDQLDRLAGISLFTAICVFLKCEPASVELPRLLDFFALCFLHFIKSQVLSLHMKPPAFQTSCVWATYLYITNLL